MTFYTNDPVDNVRAALQTYHPDHEQFAEYVIEGNRRVDGRDRWLNKFLKKMFIFRPCRSPASLAVHFRANLRAHTHRSPLHFCICREAKGLSRAREY